MGHRRSARIASRLQIVAPHSATVATNVERENQQPQPVVSSAPITTTPTQNLSSPNRQRVGKDRVESPIGEDDSGNPQQPAKKTKHLAIDSNQEAEVVVPQKSKLTFMDLPAEIRSRVYDFLFSGCVWAHDEYGVCFKDCGRQGKGRNHTSHDILYLRVSNEHADVPVFSNEHADVPVFSHAEIINDLQTSHLSTYEYNERLTKWGKDFKWKAPMPTETMQPKHLNSIQHLIFAIPQQWSKPGEIKYIRGKLLPSLSNLKVIDFHESEFPDTLKAARYGIRRQSKLTPAAVPYLLYTRQAYDWLEMRAQILRQQFMGKYLTSIYPVPHFEFNIEIVFGRITMLAFPRTPDSVHIRGPIATVKITGKASVKKGVVVVEPSEELGRIKQIAPRDPRAEVLVDDGSLRHLM